MTEGKPIGSEVDSQVVSVFSTYSAISMNTDEFFVCQQSRVIAKVALYDFLTCFFIFASLLWHQKHSKPFRPSFFDRGCRQVGVFALREVHRRAIPSRGATDVRIATWKKREGRLAEGVSGKSECLFFLVYSPCLFFLVLFGLVW